MTKKVLFLGHTPPPHHGAAIVGEMVLNIFKDNTNCEQVLISDSGGISELGQLNPFFYLTMFFRIIKKLTSNRYDIIYLTPSLNGFAFFRDISIISIIKVFNIFHMSRVLCHIHMRPLILIKYPSLMRLWLFLTKNIEIILLSNSLIKDFPVKFCSYRVHYLNNTSKVEYLQDEPVEPIVLYVGHIMESKGALRLLALVEKFIDFDCSFHFAGEFGDDETKAFFMNTIAKFPHGKVVYHGEINGKQKSILFSKSTLLALPSYSEAQPLTIIESFSCGLPVVATPVGGIPDILDNSTGRCVEFSYFESAIKNVLNDGRYKYSIACLAKYEDSFTQNDFYNNCIDILRLNDVK